jgi:DNA-binding transcriptional LysR family regulator
VRHVSTLIGLVDNGLGVAVVPQLTVPRKPASVVGVKLEKPTISRTLAIIRRSNRSLSPAAAAFAQLLMDAGQSKALRRRPTGA